MPFVGSPQPERRDDGVCSRGNSDCGNQNFCLK